MTDEERAARNAYKREWAKQNPDKIRAQQERYWAKKAAAESGRAAAGGLKSEGFPEEAPERARHEAVR